MTTELRQALGPLAVLLDDPAVTDVLVNGDSGVWVDRGAGAQRTDAMLNDQASVRRLAVRLAGLAGRRLDDAAPWVDGLLPGGVRLHAVLPPLVSGGAHLSLRVPRTGAASVTDLQARGMLDELGRRVIEAVVAARCSFVITGGTGTGKTTLLAAMLSSAADRERIVVVEDVRAAFALACANWFGRPGEEMTLVAVTGTNGKTTTTSLPHVVYLQGRDRNVEGRGEITLTTLVRQSLRMRPDRVVVGEVRGPEVRELLAALNTGHEGGCGTLHANAGVDVVPRFEALGALAGMAPAAVHAQLVSAIQVTVHLARSAGGRRELAGVSLLGLGPGGRAEVRPALVGGPGRWEHGPGWPALEQVLSLRPGTR